jgi:autotransporter-associated beta strand protein
MATHSASGATFDYASTAAQLLTGTVSGAVAVLKSGAGTLSLLGNNTFSGGLTLSTGTLGIYTNTGAGTGDITLDAGTSLLLGRAVTTIANNITLAGNATIALDTSVEYLVVGGGGGGVLRSSANLVDSSYSVVVGDGGGGGTTTSYGVVSQAPSNGGASSLLGNIEAYGGGAGAIGSMSNPMRAARLVVLAVALVMAVCAALGLGQGGYVGARDDYITRYREFKYQETLFEFFARQFEMAKLDESREGATIQVIDTATAPEFKSKPKKAMIAVLATLATGFLLLLWVFVSQSLKNASQDEASTQKLAGIRSALRRAFGLS